MTGLIDQIRRYARIGNRPGLEYGSLAQAMEQGADRLDAMLAKLPVTADGHPICPGDRLWEVYTLDGGYNWQIRRIEVEAIDRFQSIRPAGASYWITADGENRLYATRAAAEAACEARQGQGPAFQPTFKRRVSR